MTTALCGNNLVRLLYLDEAGTDAGAPAMCVSGVLVHGDAEWPEVNRLILELIERYIAEADRDGFVFHATDIFHGSKYFDRRRPEWENSERREELLNALFSIIDTLSLPVVFGFYRKQTFGVELLFTSKNDQRYKNDLMHTLAIGDCMRAADRWLEKYAPQELATVVHEDGTLSKPIVKDTVRIFRNEHLLRKSDLNGFKERFGLPLKRIIDTVHFAEKPDARPLQLADACAFVLGRMLKESPVPAYARQVLLKHAQWWVVEQQQKEISSPAGLAQDSES